jgi:hypothetical protein
MASNSASVRAVGPMASSFSRGRSPAGQSRIDILVSWESSSNKLGPAGHYADLSEALSALFMRYLQLNSGILATGSL